MPRSTKPKPIPPTTVLLVRHGQTPSTGIDAAGTGARAAPGRQGPGAGRGGRRPDRRAREGVGRVRVTPRANAGDGRADRPRPRPARADRAGPARVRVRRMDGTIAEGPGQAARVAHGPALPERLPLPRRRVVRRDADPHRRQRWPASWPAHPGETIVAVSHADPIKAAVADALGTHLDLFQRIVVSPCSISAVHYGDGRPGRADRRTPPATTSRAWAFSEATVVSTSFDFDEPDHFTTGAVGEPGHRVFYLQAARRARWPRCDSRSNRSPRWPSTSAASCST